MFRKSCLDKRFYKAFYERFSESLSFTLTGFVNFLECASKTNIHVKRFTKPAGSDPKVRWGLRFCIPNKLPSIA